MAPGPKSYQDFRETGSRLASNYRPSDLKSNALTTTYTPSRLDLKQDTEPRIDPEESGYEN